MGTGLILVTGGTGTLGRCLVPRLHAAGRTVRVLSRRPGEDGDRTRVVGDLRTGAGLAEAADGAEVIVHCATAQRGDEAATSRLLAAALEAGRPHVVYVSIVGVDRIPLPYYRQKLAAERAVAGSALPFTILRATQFHELLVRLFAVQRRLPTVFVPARTQFQPIAADEVAARLVELADGAPAGRVDDIGGPETASAAEFARRYLRMTGRRRAVLPVRIPGAIGREYRAGHQLTPNAVGTTRFPGGASR